MRSIFANMREDTRKNMPTAIGVYWWFWRRNFDLKFVIVIPVTLWATLYHYTHLFQSLYNTERERCAKLPLGRAQDIKVKVTSMVAKLVLITPILLWLIIRKKTIVFFFGGGFETHLPSRGSHIANEHHPTNLGIISNKYLFWWCSNSPKSDSY